MQTKLGLILWTCSILILIKGNDELTEDEGLRLACDQMKGQFTPRNPKSHQAGKGDVCRMTFRTATRNEQEARDFCSLYAPWRLQSAEHGLHTVCTVEATLMCKPGWIQMFGVCFRMPDKKKMKTRADAEAECSSIKGKIAYLHHKYIVGVWKNYFRGVRRVWVRASSVYNRVVQHGNNTDGSLALAFNGLSSEFAVPPNSFIKVPKDSRMQVLCEYKPSITIAEINYKSRRYDEIYYPSYDMGAGRLIRTTNHYHGNDGHPVDICKGPLKSFDMEPTFALRPNKAVSNAIRHEPSSFTRTGAERRFKPKRGKCRAANKYFGVDVRDGEKKYGNYANQECDNMLSIMFRHSTQRTGGVVASAARDAPVWCRVGNVRQRDYLMPNENWGLVERKDTGKGYGFYLVRERLTWEDAKERCETLLSSEVHLAGGNSLEEFQAMIAYIKSRGVDNEKVWLGGRRREGCADVDRIPSDPDAACSRRNVFEWLDDAGELGFRDEWWAGNLSHNERECLALIVGDPTRGTRVLDDDHCTNKRYFLCGTYLESL